MSWDDEIEDDDYFDRHYGVYADEYNKENGAAENDEEYDDLEDAGLDVDMLELMDEDERREAIEEAGLDPDYYEF